MSEEEKEANELIEKFKKYSDGVCKSGFWFSKLRDENAKQCALVCVEAKYYALREMLNLINFTCLK